MSDDTKEFADRVQEAVEKVKADTLGKRFSFEQVCATLVIYTALARSFGADDDDIKVIMECSNSIEPSVISVNELN